jgi:hypothetical protein
MADDSCIIDFNAKARRRKERHDPLFPLRPGRFASLRS